MFKQEFIAFLGFSISLATKCVFLNDKPCLVRCALIDLNESKLHYYQFMVSLDRCNESCNTLDDPSSRTYVPDETEYVNVNVFNMITRINYAKY